jgi:hypothetical protein
MQLYVLDDEGQVVFTYHNTSGKLQDQLPKSEQAKVIKMISEALRFLLKIRRL